MTGLPPPGFTGSRLDRADGWRSDPGKLAEARGSLAARLLLLHGLDPQLDADGGLAWGSLADADPERDLLFLGLLDGAPCWAQPPPADARIDPRSRRAWNVLGQLADDQLALFAGARSLADWHHRHRFCAQCGSPTHVAKGGWQRDCPACGAQHFPRVDPVVIMLAEHDGAVLVGRQHGFPPGRYSALAGFVEPGESLEEAVRRELMEEAGVAAGAVTYVASQPWPFPSSLMIGCIAAAGSRALALDASEIEDAMWVDRDAVRAVLADAPDAPFQAPPPYAIAHTLLRYWVEL